MADVFVPKKTVTVQLPLQMWQQFMRLCQVLGLTKTKTFERMITETEKNLEVAE